MHGQAATSGLHAVRQRIGSLTIRRVKHVLGQRCKASVRLVVVVLGGLLQGSVAVIGADSLSIWPLAACPAVDPSL
jgi:hypothetical protein